MGLIVPKQRVRHTARQTDEQTQSVRLIHRHIYRQTSR